MHASPSVIPPGGTRAAQKTTGLMSDPLPFYWLAQLLLVAFQESLPPFRKREASPVSSTESPYVQALYDALTLRAADIPHVNPLFAVALLKRQHEFGLLTRTPVHASTRVRGKLADPGDLLPTTTGARRRG